MVPNTHSHQISGTSELQKVRFCSCRILFDRWQLQPHADFSFNTTVCDTESMCWKRKEKYYSQLMRSFKKRRWCQFVELFSGKTDFLV